MMRAELRAMAEVVPDWVGVVFVMLFVGAIIIAALMEDE